MKAEIATLRLYKVLAILSQKSGQPLKNQKNWLKQVKIIVDNGHLALDHMQKSFQIMEKALLSAVEKVKETTETH